MHPTVENIAFKSFERRFELVVLHLTILIDYRKSRISFMFAETSSRYVTRNPEILGERANYYRNSYFSSCHCRFVAIGHYARRNPEPLASFKVGTGV